MELKSEELEEYKNTQRQQGGNAVSTAPQPKTVAERIGYAKPNHT